MRNKVAQLVLLAAGLLYASGCSQRESDAHPTPIADGFVVLVKRDQTIGAFVLRNQRIQPEVTDIVWAYRADGSGIFPVGESVVVRGESKAATRVSFADFSIEWSIHTNGSGWLYYSNAIPESFAMCVTNERHIEEIDANDPKWVFRKRPAR